MQALRSGISLALVTGLAGASLAGQGAFVPPQPPCDLTPANPKINNGIQALKGAAEKPDQTGAQLAQARKLIGDAILQDNQVANPAAWYYLGRAYVAAGD